MRENLNKVVLEGLVTKESFVRKVLVETYSAIDTPPEIDSIKLSDVHESTYQILEQKANYEIEIACEIGYDRKEQYVDQETKYDRDLGRNVTRDVVKTRTVTDWQPYDKTIKRAGTGYKEISNNDVVDLGDLNEATDEKHNHFPYNKDDVICLGVPSSNTEKISSTKFVDPTEADYDAAVDNGSIEACAGIYSELPGDHHRNEKVRWCSLYEKPTLYAVDCYKAAFEFDGDTHFARQFVSEIRPHIYSKFTSKDSVLEDIESNHKKELENDETMNTSKKYSRFSLAGIIGGAILAIAGGAIHTVVMVIGIILAIASIVLFRRFNKEYEKQKNIIDSNFKNMENEHKKKMQNKKIELLNARFASMGLDPLSDIELERFDLENAKKLSSR